MYHFELFYWEERKYQTHEHRVDILKIGLVTDKYFEMRTSLAIFNSELLINGPDVTRRKVC